MNASLKNFRMGNVVQLVSTVLMDHLHDFFDWGDRNQLDCQTSSLSPATIITKA